MSSKETLPVESKGTDPAPDLIQQFVAADGLGEVFGQYPAEELSRPLRAADDARTSAVREDRRMSGDSAFHRTNLVQRVPAEEQLKIAGTQIQPAHEIAFPGQHRPDVVEIFAGGGPDVRTVLEAPAAVCLLGEQAHGELVRVEVPRVRSA